MKTVFKISLILNLGLLGCLFHLWPVQRQLKNASSPPIVLKSNPLVQMIPASPLPATQQPAPNPFRWNQLESAADYRIYIKNLRAIGCPEQTLRDIVSGNVDRAFSAERRQLNLDENMDGPWSMQAEIQFVSILLEERADSNMQEMSSEESGSGHDPISFPLVLQKVDLDALSLSDDQKQVIAQIQKQFIDQIGGPYQDPDDPAYHERWQKAQPQSDDMLKAMLGTTIFENYQLAAANAKGGN